MWRRSKKRKKTRCKFVNLLNKPINNNIEYQQFMYVYLINISSAASQLDGVIHNQSSAFDKSLWFIGITVCFWFCISMSVLWIDLFIILLKNTKIKMKHIFLLFLVTKIQYAKYLLEINAQWGRNKIHSSWVLILL